MNHNHGAAVSGATSEKNLKEFLNKRGYKLLKKKGELEEEGLESLSQLPIPDSMRNLDSEEQYHYFLHDGIVPSLKLMIESKYTKQKGTTEEKIWCDYRKIKKGVYNNPNGFDLWYIIWGPQALRQPIYADFEREAKEEKLPVKVLRLESLAELKPYITQRIKELNGEL